MTAECIQQSLNEDIADIPLFYGIPDIDTIKPATFMDHIEQGITSLAWTPAQAFTYFRNALQGKADNWLRNTLYSYPDLALTWTVYKPLFCKKFDIVSVKNMFINKVAKLTLTSCKNNLDEYFRQVNNTIHSQMERFIAPTVDYPANPDFTNEHRTFVAAVIKRNCSDIFESLKVKCVINGLPQTNFDRLKNKAGMNTAIKMFTFLDRDRAFKNALADRATTLAAIYEDQPQDDTISAARQSNTNNVNLNNCNNSNNGNRRASNNGNHNNSNNHNGNNQDR